MNKVTTPSTWTELNNIINSEPTDTYIAIDELQDYIDSGELSYFDGLMAHGKAISSDTSLGVKTQNCIVGTDAELDSNKIHLTDMVGVGGWTNYEAILMAIMNAVGIKVKDFNVGDNIHDAFATIDQAYLDKYINMLKDVHSGDKYILYYNDKTYIRLQAFGMLITEFINDGIFEATGEIIRPQNIAYGSWYEVIEPMTVDEFKEAITIVGGEYYNKIYNKSVGVDVVLSALDKMNNDGLIPTGSVINFGGVSMLNSDIVGISLVVYYSVDGGSLEITRTNNYTNELIYSTPLDTIFNYSDADKRISIRSHTKAKTHRCVRGINYILSTGEMTYDYNMDSEENYNTNPNYNFKFAPVVREGYGWNVSVGTIKSQSVAIQGIELMSDAVKLDIGWDIATDYPTWESNKLLLHGYINEQIYELEHYPIRYDATKIVSDTLANAQDGVSDYDKDSIDKGKYDAKEQGAITPTEPTIPTTPTPIILPPSTDDIGMYRIYNPTPSQLQSITNFLWSKSEGEGGSFFDNVTKLFQDPMQCIIGLSRVYAPVSVGGTEQFTIGKVTVPTSWLSLPVNTTSSQYSEVDMGSVSIKEYFGDVRDYDGYTQIQIYLPFIGFRQLKTNDVMGGTIHLTYYVDILTGNCNAKIDVSRKNMVRQCLYTFDGNCSEQIPVSGSNYTNLISSTLMGMISGAGTGGQIGAVVGGTTSLMSGMSNNVQRSGSISGSLGAINIKKPYLIISRPIPADANTFNNFYGYPANKTIRLGNCSGYTKVKSVHVEGIICTDEEKNMIESQLKQGVLV